MAVCDLRTWCASTFRLRSVAVCVWTLFDQKLVLLGFSVTSSLP